MTLFLLYPPRGLADTGHTQKVADKCLWPGGREKAEQPGGSQPRAQQWAPGKPRSTSPQPTPQEADAQKGWVARAWAGGQPVAQLLAVSW